MAVLCCPSGYGCLRGFYVSYIARDEVRPAARLGDPRCGVFATVRVNVQKQQVVAKQGKTFDQRRADSAGTSGYQYATRGVHMMPTR